MQNFKFRTNTSMFTLWENKESFTCNNHEWQHNACSDFGWKNKANLASKD